MVQYFIRFLNSLNSLNSMKVLINLGKTPLNMLAKYLPPQLVMVSLVLLDTSIYAHSQSFTPYLDHRKDALRGKKPCARSRLKFGEHNNLYRP